MSFSDKIFYDKDVSDYFSVIRKSVDKIVFTNGCFDLVHYGHIKYLHDASTYGDFLIVGLNSDESISRLKGYKRPINDLKSRSSIIASLYFVDLVVVFNDDTPIDLIEHIRPDFLIKGGDWNVRNIIGQEFVSSYGGTVLSIPVVEGYSTTAIENKIIKNKYYESSGIFKTNEW